MSDANTVELRAETGYTRAETWLVDFSDFASVKRFADQFEKDGGRLDILVANAGTEPGRYVATKDGWDITSVLLSLRSRTPAHNLRSLQVNYLGVSLAGILLLPLLLRTAEEHGTLSRLVFVSSDLHYDVVVEKDARTTPGKILATLSDQEYLKKGS